MPLETEYTRTDLEIDQIREPYTGSFLKNAAGKERKDTPSHYGSEGKTTIYNAHENGALPRDVLKIPALASGAGRSERWFICRTCGPQIYPPVDLSEHREHDILKHPTQKPMELQDDSFWLASTEKMERCLFHSFVQVQNVS